MASIVYNFSGKTALVTGAGGGIGRSTAIALSAAGALTYALDKIQQNLDALTAKCPDVRAVCVDLSDWDATKKAVEAIGPIDLLVNNAGVTLLQSFLDVDPNAFDTVIGINVKAVIAVSQVVARGMIDRRSAGAIVNMSSVASVRALQDHTVYCASKGALDQVTRVMALELGPHQIRVNAVQPTVVMTDMGRQAWSDPARSGPVIARLPLGRFAEESDVVNAVLFLLSDESRMIHGHFLSVDGGYLVH